MLRRFMLFAMVFGFEMGFRGQITLPHSRRSELLFLRLPWQLCSLPFLQYDHLHIVRD